MRKVRRHLAVDDVVDRRIGELFLYLERLETARISHSGRPFISHLFATYEVLTEWRQPFDVCVAGLFHSIYGTFAIKQASVGLDQRPKIKDLIGTRAEDLVYMYSAVLPMSLLNGIQQGQDRPNLQLLVGDAIWVADHAVCIDLLHILVANWVEQRGRMSPLANKRDKLSFQSVSKFLSEPAQAAIAGWS